MQHSAVDLETYARLYVEDRLRVSAQLRRADAVMTEASWLERAVARVQSWLMSASRERVVEVPVASQPVHLVPVVKKEQPVTADPFAGMIVLVRGPKESCGMDAA